MYIEIGAYVMNMLQDVESCRRLGFPLVMHRFNADTVLVLR
jgi:hypothetical protein